MMRPPCSRTMPWLIESPSPVPWPSALVVKNGSNTWAARVSDMPGPSSMKSMATPSSQRRARTMMVPGRPVDAMAWAALLIRLTKTCWIWFGSMSGMGRSGSTSIRASTRCAMSWFRSSTKVASSSGLERRGAPLVVLLAGEAEQVLHDVGGALGLLLNDGERLAQGGGDVGHFGEEIGEPDHRCERVVEVVGDAGDELPDGRHLFRLDQLVLQSPPFGLIIEQEHHGGPVGAANRHRGNGIGPLAGA